MIDGIPSTRPPFYLIRRGNPALPIVQQCIGWNKWSHQWSNANQAITPPATNTPLIFGQWYNNTEVLRCNFSTHFCRREKFIYLFGHQKGVSAITWKTFCKKAYPKESLIQEKQSWRNHHPVHLLLIHWHRPSLQDKEVCHVLLQSKHAAMVSSSMYQDATKDGQRKNGKIVEELWAVFFT